MGQISGDIAATATPAADGVDHNRMPARNRNEEVLDELDRKRAAAEDQQSHCEIGAVYQGQVTAQSGRSRKLL